MARFTGSYRSTRSNETTLDKVHKLFVPIHVYAKESGLLHITGLAGVPEPLISLVLTAVVLSLALLVWKRKYWNLWGRVHYTLVAFAGAAFIGSLHYWNLLGYRI